MIRAVPLNLITGFLGAGKTTAIRHLLAHRRDGERWAVLVNEFGQVGIDQAVLGGEGIAIKEVPGGCLCCANQLPLQVALSQLLTRARPDRVLIEPTGLGHPARVLETLREAHWRDALDVRATLTLVDARELADARVLAHETFNAQVEAADVLVFSKDDVLADADRTRARDFAAGLLPPKAHVFFMASGELAREWLDLPDRAVPVKRSLLHVPPGATGVMAGAPGGPDAGAGRAGGRAAAEIEPPFHYSENLPEAAIAGWVFPREWVFGHNALLDVLFGIREAMRVKGVFHTDQGWIFFNATRHETAVNSEPSRSDSRLEVIARVARDWPALEAALLAARQPG
ncbi:MAG: cobalamin synthesis protein [Moraxellaceae bacterium]|jgi:G3E family GTPase|nr:cobalamin synthesis protein [Moraxellaceae bacterium]